jgi:hypothetical protein
MNICPILLAAIIQVESSGNPRAYNQREDAVGILQIRRILVDDLNRIYGPSAILFIQGSLGCREIKRDVRKISWTLWDEEKTRKKTDE